MPGTAKNAMQNLKRTHKVSYGDRCMVKDPAPRVVKPRPWGDRGRDYHESLWVNSMGNFPTAEAHADWMAGQIAWSGWVSALGRMWNYIGRWEASRCYCNGLTINRIVE